jgi:hypothetical protein
MLKTTQKVVSNKAKKNHKKTLKISTKKITTKNKKITQKLPQALSAAIQTTNQRNLHYFNSYSEYKYVPKELPRLDPTKDNKPKPKPYNTHLSPEEIDQIVAFRHEVCDAWHNRPAQLKSIQFPEWCLETYIPTKPFTEVLREIAESDPDDARMSKATLLQVFIPLWKAYHHNLSKYRPSFAPTLENTFSPSAVTVEDLGELHYPQVLHHHFPDIVSITKRFVNFQTGEILPVDLQAFELHEVNDAQFRPIYEAAVLLRYLHHQEGLIKYIKHKMKTQADVSVFDTDFYHEVQKARLQYRDQPNTRPITPNDLDIHALRQVENLNGYAMDITNSSIPADIRWKHYIDNDPVQIVCYKTGIKGPIINYHKLIERCDLPSEPILHSLHAIAKHFTKASLLHDSSLSTEAVRTQITDYAQYLWDNLNVFINPTEANKENLYQLRGETDLDRFYAYSLEHRNDGGWKGRDTILQWPLTAVANPDPSLSAPLPLKTIIHYAFQYAKNVIPATLQRQINSKFGASQRPPDDGDITPYLHVLYTVKSINNNTFGLELEMNNFHKTAVGTNSALIKQVPAGSPFSAAVPLLRNPTSASSKGKNMMYVPLYSQEYRYLFENNELFQDIIKQNFEEETQYVTDQLEAAYHSIQRQYERFIYHKLLTSANAKKAEQNGEQNGEKVEELQFSPDELVLQRYNDQAFYLQEIIHDSEIFAGAFLKMTEDKAHRLKHFHKRQEHLNRGVDIGELYPEYSIGETEESINLDYQKGIDTLMDSPRQSAVFIEKWLNESNKRFNEANVVETWNDLLQANSIFSDFYTRTPDKRRCIASLYTDLHNKLLKATNHDIKLVSRDGFGTQKPAFVCRPKGEKGSKRVISRFEFPTREDLHTFFKLTQPLSAKIQSGIELDKADKVDLINLREFYGLERRE